ncbi:TetR/AcrR family transcriptional regulator [Zavarzinia sp. CC-PAN008]|uniref:TetR/AcrR family transcriptional regulator n=1 Tax=Zavarzinia sp. CC-PAN008 TaxID=3243332 RepID=UPI003F7431FB
MRPDDEDEAGADLGRRAQSMALRRRQIVDAARALVHETGDTGFTMRTLAAKAGVSLATPYNLFGSKHAVMMALGEADLNRFRALVQGRPAGDALDRLFDVIILTRAIFYSEPSFYRALYKAVFDPHAPELRLGYVSPRQNFWLELVRDAQRAGLIRAEVEPKPLSRLLALIFGGVVQNWILADFSAERFESEIGYGFALTLGAAASPLAEARLRQLLRDFQARLCRAYPRHGDPDAPGPRENSDSDSTESVDPSSANCL